MNWAGIKCWWEGHDVRQQTAVIAVEVEKNVTTTTRYGKCKKCGKGTLENGLSAWDDDKSFIERHEVALSILLFILGFLSVIFVLAVLVLATQRYGCRVNAEIMELPWKFHWITGNCYYELEGRWIARNLLKVVDLLK